MERFEKNKLIFFKMNPAYMNKVYPFSRIQKGGQIEKTKRILYEGKYYKFDYIHEEETDMYMFYDSKNKYQCVVILVYKDDKNAIIQNINGDYQDCPNGSTILEVSIKFLKEYKSKLGIKRILLQDNSIKKCNGLNIHFWAMYTLLYGKTWYMTHGFLPYNQEKNTVDNIKLAGMSKNLEIMRNAKITDLQNFGKYVNKYASKDLKLKITNKLKEKPNKKVFGFIQWLLLEYDPDSCNFFYNVYEKIMVDLGIHSMVHTMYFMTI